MAQLKSTVVAGNLSVTGSTYCDNFIGNASTASKLQTARTIALTGSVTGSGTFDGSGNLSITTTTNHNHDSVYVNVTGDTMTGGLTLATDSSAYNTKGLIFGSSESGSRIGGNTSKDLGIYAYKDLYIRPAYGSATTYGLKMTSSDFSPTTNKSMSLGTSSYQYNNIYANILYEGGTSLTNKYVTLSTTQTISGVKTFSASSGFNYSGIENATSDVSRHVWFSHSTNKGTPVYNDNFKYNPSGNKFMVGTSTATTAQIDLAGCTVKYTSNTKSISFNFV